MAPVLLNQMPQPLLLLDFVRKTTQGFFLLRLPTLQTFHLCGLPPSRPGLFEALFFPTLQCVGVVQPFPSIDGFAK